MFNKNRRLIRNNLTRIYVLFVFNYEPDSIVFTLG